MMKLIEAYWFNTGAIVVVDTGREYKAYCGGFQGLNEKADIENVMDWGGTVTIDTLERILAQLKSKQKKQEGKE